MTSLKQFVESLTQGFSVIELDKLNDKAKLLERTEQKYIVELDLMPRIMDDLRKGFSVLTIAGETLLAYKNMYYDTQDQIAYKYHNQNNRKRFKVRTRYYAGIDRCYLEIKLKDRSGRTVKTRMLYALEDYAKLTPGALVFLGDRYKEHYSRDFDFALSPILEVEYRRVTLVANERAERVTIDFDIRYTVETGAITPRPFVIIETKSVSGRGVADRVMKRYGLRSQGCSKYCLGAILLGLNVKYNRFKPLMKRIDSVS